MASTLPCKSPLCLAQSEHCQICRVLAIARSCAISSDQDCKLFLNFLPARQFECNIACNNTSLNRAAYLLCCECILFKGRLPSECNHRVGELFVSLEFPSLADFLRIFLLQGTVFPDSIIRLTGRETARARATDQVDRSIVLSQDERRLIVRLELSILP